MSKLFVLVGFAIALSGFVAYRRYSRKTGRFPLPPGPKPLPIVGNIMDLPPKGVPEFEHWLKHKDAYGPISSVSILGQTLIILHDKQAVLDLFQKRAKVCSGRPDTEFVKLCGYSKWVVLQQDGEYLRRCRKLMHQQLGTKLATPELSNIEDVEVRRFLFHIMTSPEALVKHVKTTASAIISKIVYGYAIESHKPDPLVELVELNLANAQRATTPGWLVDAVPALKYLPTGFPGTGFKETARKWNRINQMSTDLPYAFVQRQVASHNFRPSFVSTLIQQHVFSTETEGDSRRRDENDARWSAAMLYNGGLDTTVPIISGFVVAMAMFPHVQVKAQEEIDRVVGMGRLPGFVDRQNLPYVEAIVQEAYRWNPTAPLGFAHMASEETMYNGYLIPKGSILLPAIWWFCHDPEVYSDPDAFEPARFLAPRNEPNASAHIFGYGRRVCPGQHVADSSIFLTIVRMLAAFDIGKATDKLGRKIDIKLNTNTGIINRPVDFPYTVAPRGSEYEEMIRRVEVEHPWEKSDADLLTGKGRN